MATTAELMAAGFSAAQASVLGADNATGITAAGTTQATATALASAFTEVGTAAANSGVLLPAFPKTCIVSNGGANAIKVYPPVGHYMNGTQNASFSVTNAKTATFYRSGQRWIGVLSA